VLRRIEYFRIFDRWGGLVFETNELNTPWDGNINGKQAELATYVYLVKGECSNGDAIQKSGNITLVR
jgi:gliding motility-associated-like protein